MLKELVDENLTKSNFTVIFIEKEKINVYHKNCLFYFVLVFVFLCFFSKLREKRHEISREFSRISHISFQWQKTSSDRAHSSSFFRDFKVEKTIMNQKSLINLLIFSFYLVLVVAFFTFLDTGCEFSCVNICSSNENSSIFNETTTKYEIIHPLTNETTIFEEFKVGFPCENFKILPANQWKLNSVT